MNNKIWFHADDYGVTIEQSKRILACHTNGVLNSISILPNTGLLPDAAKLLNEVDPDKNKIRRVLHLNFVEGKSLSEASCVPLLVDRTGFFNKSFIQFFKWNYIKKGINKKHLVKQIKEEIRAQIRAVTFDNDFGITAIDSHQHYHMIPIIFDSLMDVLSEPEFQQLSIHYIRIPVDPLTPILHHTSMRRDVPKVNWIKWSVLKLYAKRNKKLLQKEGILTPIFFGILYTCKMKMEVVKALLPAYQAYANRKGKQLELMFHPGNLTASNELLDERSKELAVFYMSDDRFHEAECLKLLRHDPALNM